MPTGTQYRQGCQIKGQPALPAHVSKTIFFLFWSKPVRKKIAFISGCPKLDTKEYFPESRKKIFL